MFFLFEYVDCDIVQENLFSTSIRASSMDRRTHQSIEYSAKIRRRRNCSISSVEGNLAVEQISVIKSSICSVFKIFRFFDTGVGVESMVSVHEIDEAVVGSVPVTTLCVDF
jgi:hypothetical protein